MDVRYPKTFKSLGSVSTWGLLKQMLRPSITPENESGQNSCISGQKNTLKLSSILNIKADDSIYVRVHLYFNLRRNGYYL